MSQIHPVQALLDDHRVIEGVLNIFEAKLSARPHEPFPGCWLADALEFFRHFVEGCHHDKEEHVVFPALRVPELLEEHRSGAAYLDRLEIFLQAARCGEAPAREAFRREGLAYVAFLRDHVRREDILLHWVARQPASAAEIERLQEGFSPEEFHQMSEESHQAYMALAERLCAAKAA